MEDVLYPGNKEREGRVEELGADIGSLMNDLSKDATEIQRLLNKLDETIREMYRDIEVDIPADSSKEFEYKGWKATVSELLASLIFFGPIELALKKAAVMALRCAGRIAEAAFFDALSIGLDALTFIKFGVEAGAVVAVVGIDIIIGAAFGAEKKHKLRHSIHSAIHPRIQLKKAAMINNIVREKLQTVLDSCDMMKEVGYTKDQLDQAQMKIADKTKEEVATITDETAKQALADLDKNRGSWTKEDH